MEGFINFLKPPGMTSHDVVGFVRRVLHEKRVGHAGTLDPGAAGVLPVAVGQATRLIEYLDNERKTYRAEMLLGYETDSGDDSGRILDQLTDFVMPEAKAIKEVFAAFTGGIVQVPPAYSAIKINGQRAYDLVRQGVRVEIPSRRVEIFRLALVEKNDAAKTLLFDVECSKGTYIRTLCQDMGRAMNIPATMSFLVRTGVGGFSIQNAVTPEEFQVLGENALQPGDAALSHILKYNINPARKKAFCNGLSSFDKAFSEKIADEKNIELRVYCEDIFLGMGHYDCENKTIVPDKVLIR